MRAPADVLKPYPLVPVQMEPVERRNFLHHVRQSTLFLIDALALDKGDCDESLTGRTWWVVVDGFTTAHPSGHLSVTALLPKCVQSSPPSSVAGSARQLSRSQPLRL